ncbi:MAG: hypothetical protein KGS00_11040 [Alphaproteobacteria bacterium]|nr:hypothetical protein [Alphaproteobacteria bacterium]
MLAAHLIRKLAVPVAALALAAGCATVSVYEPRPSSEAPPDVRQSVLRQASEAYCRETRKKGLAVGQGGFGSIAGLLTGADETGAVYSDLILDANASPAATLERVRADVGDVTRGLQYLDELARAVLAQSVPSGSDVTEFEKALIHARQAREALSDALATTNVKLKTDYSIEGELEDLDRTLTRARVTADDLASALEPVGAFAQTLG